jgi:hypothetical protein
MLRKGCFIRACYSMGGLVISRAACRAISFICLFVWEGSLPSRKHYFVILVMRAAEERPKCNVCSVRGRIHLRHDL